MAGRKVKGGLVRRLMSKLDFEIEDRGLEIVGEEKGFGKAGAKKRTKKKPAKKRRGRK